MTVCTPTLFLSLSTVAHAYRDGNSLVELLVQVGKHSQPVRVIGKDDCDAVMLGLQQWGLYLNAATLHQPPAENSQSPVL